MKRRLTLIGIAVLLLLSAFLVLMTRMHSPEEALAPPNPDGELRQLQQAFESAVGSGTEYKLQYPDEGDYRSAYVLYDLDGDEEYESLVFYTKAGDENNVRVHLLDQQDGRWVSLLDEKGYGSKIDSVSFSDLDGDETAEVFLTWSLAGTESTRTLTVHSVDLKTSGKSSAKTLATMPCKAMHVSDLDNDGNNELLVLWSEATAKVQHNRAQLMKLSGGKLSAYGAAVELDREASLYDSIVRQEGKTPLVFVDARRGDGSMLTEVLWWDGVNKALRAPFTEDGSLNTVTERASDLLTSDIDEDGIYEIPVAYRGNGTDTAKSQEELLPLTAWSVTGTADPGNLQPKAYSIVDTTNHFILYLSTGYRDSVLVYRNTKTGVITVYRMDDDLTRGEPLFSLVYGTGDAPKDYTFLAEQDGRTVSGTLTSAGKAEGLTDKTIQDNIVFY